MSAKPETHTISEVLRQLLFAENITPMELSRRTKVSQPTIQRLYRGTQQAPRASSLKPIAEYFHLSLNQLTGKEPIPDLTFPVHRHMLPLLDWDALPVFCEKGSVSDAVTRHPSELDIAKGCLVTVDAEHANKTDFIEGTRLTIALTDKLPEKGYVLAKTNQSFAILAVEWMADKKSWMQRQNRQDNWQAFDARKVTVYGQVMRAVYSGSSK